MIDEDCVAWDILTNFSFGFPCRISVLINGTRSKGRVIGAYRASNNSVRGVRQRAKCTVSIFRTISVFLCLSETKFLRRSAILSSWLDKNNEYNFGFLGKREYDTRKIEMRKDVGSVIRTYGNITFFNKSVYVQNLYSRQLGNWIKLKEKNNKVTLTDSIYAGKSRKLYL